MKESTVQTAIHDSLTLLDLYRGVNSERDETQVILGRVWSAKADVVQGS